MSIKLKKIYNLETKMTDLEEAVKTRRTIIEQNINKQVFKDLPFKGYDYSKVLGQCCENVVGYIQIPLGLAGPIMIDGSNYMLPLATTEGTLVASTSRGANAITSSGGCVTEIINNGMTRSPVITTDSVKEAVAIKDYCVDNFLEIKSIFESTSNYLKLLEIKSTIVGKHIYLRFKATTGDAMGMNMVGKGTQQSVQFILNAFPNARLVSLSGNTCVDKKASALNWIEGRGKTVVCESIIKKDIIEKVLKTTVEQMVELNYLKNMVGSSIAGTIGGNNAHAANIVTAMFIACGQDVAQNIESSHCMTLMELSQNKQDLYVSVTMPSLEVGTIGGGTHLSSQSAMLDLLGVKGANTKEPGKNAELLARIISAGVLAGELSLIAALSTNELIEAHMKYNRKT